MTEVHEPAPSLSEVLDRFVASVFSAEDRLVVQEALQDREDRIVGHLHMAGMQFGLYPQIVAEVLATVGLGTPPTVEGRALIRQQFVTLMEELRRQQGSG